MNVVVDDHLLRDILADQRGLALRVALRGAKTIATTNLFYARLCRSAAAAVGGGQLLTALPSQARVVVSAKLIELPPSIVVLPMKELAWDMGMVSAEFRLSTLGAEAIVAAKALKARLAVWNGNDGPRIKEAASANDVPYLAVER